MELYVRLLTLGIRVWCCTLLYCTYTTTCGFPNHEIFQIMLHKLTHITLPHGAITCHFSVSWHITHYNENESFLMANNHQISAQIWVFLPLHGIFQVIFKVSSFGASLNGSLFFLFHYTQL